MVEVVQEKLTSADVLSGEGQQRQVLVQEIAVLKQCENRRALGPEVYAGLHDVFETFFVLTDTLIQTSTTINKIKMMT